MLVEVGTLMVVLSTSCPRRSAGEYAVSADSSTGSVISVGGACEPDLLFSDSLERALAADLASVLNVRQVFVERAENNLLVWIALDNPTREVRERVFQKQYDLIDGFPEISFDFNLIADRGRSAEEFASAAKLIYSREG